MSTASSGVRVAISDQFLDSMMDLAAAGQRAVRSFIRKFRSNPLAPGLNYERIKSAADNRVRSLRVDQSHRAIVLKPERGDVHVLLWVGPHDDAYAWASRHRCAVDAASGALQLLTTDMSSSTSPEAPVPGAPEMETDTLAVTRPFSALDDGTLAKLGVADREFAAVRDVSSEQALDALVGRLSANAYDNLFMLLAGAPLAELLEGSCSVEPEDISKALDTPASKARFALLHSDEELERILDAPLERWRVFLHPAQRRLVERDWNGPVRVLGAAGTGKTVVAMHRACWLAKSGRRVLFVTFSRNLAADIEQNLLKLCDRADAARIEVVNIDRWLRAFLSSQAYPYEIVYGRDRDAWVAALNQRDPSITVPDQFYDDEWELVVQGLGIASFAEYLKAPRTGRGTPLDRRQRAIIWPVFESYRRLLEDRDLVEAGDAYRVAAQMLSQNPGLGSIDSVIVDEAQDMGSEAFRLLRRLVPAGSNDLFIVGDGHQRIYGRNRVVLSRTGIEVRGRSRKLRISYRTTQQVRLWAQALLEGREIDDLDGGADDNHGTRSVRVGPRPAHHHFKNAAEQCRWLVDFATTAEAQGYPARGVCVVARTTRHRDEARLAVQTAGLATVTLDAGLDAPDLPGMRFATMHRVKGLEFDHVIIVGANEGVIPLPQALAGAGDEAERQRLEIEERSLLYVAATRARLELTILSYGTPSSFLES